MKLIQLIQLLSFAITVLGFSDSVYNKLFEITNYAKISYCSVDERFTTGPFSEECSDLGFCKKEEQKDTTIEAVVRPNFFESEISGDSYVAVNDEDKQVYIVFRGSVTPGDWITDITFAQCPYASALKNDIKYDDFDNGTDSDSIKATILSKSNNKLECEDCYVHCGVYAEFTKSIQDLNKAAKPYLDKGYNLTITGHSLGGGYATLGAAEFRNLGYNPLTITYASLRVGNPAFNKWLDSIYNTEENAKIVGNGGDLPIPSYSRVHQETDVVPRLPPSVPGVLEYTHSGLDFSITKVLLPHNKENVVFQGASDNDKNDAVDVKFQPGMVLFIYQHLHQFQRIGVPCNDWDYLD
ncbi:putative lipase [Wickerhamomyces ciferrii]|uniref:triacylglycerol lipase n=1 Tax=Wickerhamomyces ciferrii (strain ATCC 14091 / BCRC 22168 / CBS 111 / JCM 3599 / NBRC 0793 / NRRL Y-1031 F-60-10) TaxID=1206466 RepID=K0KX04_WICCF|nr:putative lipase [Wickerhamomyces ciferrii]CCH46582.1 putative lipase [Wickerhamomyces ciferrii]